MQRAGTRRSGADRRGVRARVDAVHGADARRDHHRDRDLRLGARGAFLLAVYCAGLGVPFLITGLAFGKATAAFDVVSATTRW